MEHSDARAILEDLAERVPARVTADELGVSAAVQGRLQAVADRARTRARERWFVRWWRRMRGTAGVNVVFSGPSGTDKRAAAGAVAGSLDADLYRIDLSQVVSKYIGETEKNLGLLFSAAETIDAVLLFDEADALFATATQVPDAVDQYANLETNFLLGRIAKSACVVIISSAEELADTFDGSWLLVKFAPAEGD